MTTKAPSAEAMEAAKKMWCRSCFTEEGTVFLAHLFDAFADAERRKTIEECADIALDMAQSVTALGTGPSATRITARTLSSRIRALLDKGESR